VTSALRLVFAGTPDFAVPCLRVCLAASGVEVVAVYTQPDRPAGRGRQIAQSPIKQIALSAQLTVEQPQTLKSIAARDRLRELKPDLLVVVAYGLILPQRILDTPTHGGWNVHASLLPRWRGAAPIQRAILAGDSRTGVCLMQMYSGLDTGPVLASTQCPIDPEDTGGSLHDRLSVLGAELLAAGLQRLVSSGPWPATEQSEDGVTYAHKLEKAEALLDFNAPAAELERKVRAFNPWPIAEAVVAGERMRVWTAKAIVGKSAPPGTLVAAGRAGLDIASTDGILRIARLQRAGGRAISAQDFLNARADLRNSGG
jgi:methionyl-tRNA formyltransferase